jgi:hypothetical protein
MWLSVAGLGIAQGKNCSGAILRSRLTPSDQPDVSDAATTAFSDEGTSNRAGCTTFDGNKVVSGACPRSIIMLPKANSFTWDGFTSPVAPLFAGCLSARTDFALGKNWF